jgi:prepilin peptidase CpaA
LTYPAALAGVALSLVSAPPSPWQCLAGLAGALLLFGALRQIGRMGAGDVKLMAAVGALKGLPFVVFGSFYILTVAALTAIAMLAMSGRLLPTLRWVGALAMSTVTPGRKPCPLIGAQTDMPLAPAIFVGTMWALYLEMVNGPFTF